MNFNRMPIKSIRCENEHTKLFILKVDGHYEEKICTALSVITQLIQWLLPNSFTHFDKGYSIIVIDEQSEFEMYNRIFEFLKLLCERYNVVLDEKLCTKFFYLRENDKIILEFFDTTSI